MEATNHVKKPVISGHFQNVDVAFQKTDKIYKKLLKKTQKLTFWAIFESFLVKKILKMAENVDLTGFLRVLRERF